MTFQPVVPISGLSGWTFLQNTLPRQTEAYNSSPVLTRDTDYFAQNIGSVDSAEALVSDRRLLRVALGAFGLQDDINSKALIQKVLEEGTIDDNALANRLSDDRYRQLSQAFGFGDFTGMRTGREGFADEINALYRRRSFEAAVGEQDQTMRLALNAKRELVEIAGRDDTENTKWFNIMGVQPLRQVFETVLGLPSGFGQLDLDRQLDEFKSRASSQLGLSSLAGLKDPEVLDDLVERFVLRDQISASESLSTGSIALSILQSAQPLNSAF
ncbi:DUF1217 domain-containing protein [Roseovarius sp. 2305UL8-3]|uniref:DUF1217 domain-containing protein n=1 Tax=Roseovarius conchicola TaxID=3121636 RepID=UPI0035284F27